MMQQDHALAELEEEVSLHPNNKSLSITIQYHVSCDFKAGIRKKLDRHLESPYLREKVDLQVESVSTLISQTPRYIIMEQDIVKLRTARHWIGVSQVVETQVGDTSAEEEDIKSQLL